MKSYNRRQFMRCLPLLPIVFPLFAKGVRAADCQVPHPILPPDSQFQGQCPVCGMVRPMWARTWITFHEFKHVSQVCSFHCLADWIAKSGHEPAGVMLSLYHQPQKAVPAGKAVIVLGATAAGTMSPVSKIVFADRSEAQDFAHNCGGEVVDYKTALQAAKAGVGNENRMIQARRLKKGKIVEPRENDRCLVCGMYPQRYPYGKCQIKATDGRTVHFCSTQCLFAFMGKQALYLDTPLDPLLIWVVDRNTGLWISARTAFYVIGSRKVFGPMGYEAFVFNSGREADAFGAAHGGRTALFGDITIQDVVPDWQYPDS